jgi:hypothetical protein
MRALFPSWLTDFAFAAMLESAPAACRAGDIPAKGYPIKNAFVEDDFLDDFPTASAGAADHPHACM